MHRLALLLLLFATLAGAQSVTPMLEHHDPSGFSIDHPAGWNLARPGGARKLVIGQHAGDHLLLCNVDEARLRTPLEISQKQLDEQLVRGFQTPKWPQELAGSRAVLSYEVRGVGDVPMGTIEWEGAEDQQGRPTFARGVKVFRFMPYATWSVECAVVSETKFLAEAYFRKHGELFGRILSSVRFPE